MTDKSSAKHSDKEAIERMNKALKKMLETPPETHEDMVRRRKKLGAKRPKR
jgi:hypothetical protein